MKRIDLLKRRQARLKEEIMANLDLLIGTVGKSPSMAGHNLTTKVEGKTVSLYVRKDLSRKAKEMTRRYKKLRLLIQKLSKVNWEILKLDNE
ncbi:hypothetical protein BMS3Abin07_00820 [bacterium BMS3Abin07]|nr:hypothetical protein BMS3Abin07_00820 [bacterium BMS3Abin07]GBE33239.1 hypothetical protein BMS3Bbin05_02178 [bacterium BMS3Bbin05]HDL20764.1 hypothetical protein [Nitrospirota bacterium]HDO23185.1 hypothetical protein [Nitrospirota bacterium]